MALILLYKRNDMSLHTAEVVGSNPTSPTTFAQYLRIIPPSYVVWAVVGFAAFYAYCHAVYAVGRST